MRVLVACEFSGIVRDAFIAHGHHAVSCDLLPSERAGPHIQDDVIRHLGDGWDIMVAHPPCTYLAISGARWFAQRLPQMEAALFFVRRLMNAPVPRIAIENPVSVISTRIRPADQTIQPWQFGVPETKAICLWLKGLPPLAATHAGMPDLFLELAPEQRVARVHHEPPSPNRWKNRSRFYEPVASAMAAQWGVSTREEHK
jgi:hypothetical protein